MPSADQLLDAAGVPNGAMSADDLLDAGGVPPDPHASGQQAAQGAGVKAVAPQLPIKLPAFGSNHGIAPSAPSAPAAPSNDESTFAATDTPPGVAAPAAAQAVRNVGGWGSSQEEALKQQNFDAIKAAQNSILSAKLNAVRTALGGADFDSAHGDDSAWQRARMGMMANSADREKYLKDVMPPGTDVKTIDVQGVGPMVVFKPPGATAYQPVRGTEDSWLHGKLGDVLSAAPAVAGQAGAAYATDGATLLPRLFTQALSGAAERGLELGTNAAGGYDSQNLEGDAADMAKSAVASDVGELGGAALSYAGRSAAGAAGGALQKVGATGAAKPFQDIGATIPGIMKPSIEGEERIAAESRLRDANPGLTPLAFDQLAHPLAEAKGQRLRAISTVLPNMSYQQRQTMADMLANAATVDGGKPALPNVGDVVAGMKSDAAAPLAGVQTTEPVEAGRALADIYRNAISPVVNRTNDKYGKVMEAMTNAPGNENGVAHLDLRDLFGQIDKEATPIYGQAPPREVTKEVPVDLGTKTETSIEPADIRVGGGISPNIQSIIDRLRGLNPVNGAGPMTERSVSPYEAVKGLRSQLSEASVYNPLAPGADRAASAQAGRIMGPLDQALENPVGVDAAAVKPQIDAAKNSKTFQTDILDNPEAIRARNETSPERNMDLATPENTTFLTKTQRLANATGQSDLYKRVQSGIETKLMRQPDKIPTLFDSGAASPNTLSRMLTPESQSAFMKYKDNLDKLNTSLASKVAKEPDFVKRASMIAESGDLQGAADIIQRSGGTNSPTAENTRAAFYQSILKNSTDPKSGKLDMGLLAKNTGKLAADPAAGKVFNPETIQKLKDIQTFANAADSTSAGTGSSFMASAVAEKMSVVRPDKWLGLIAATLEAKLQGKLYTIDRAGIMNRGVPTGRMVRQGATGASAYDLNQKRQEPEVGR